jgi:recombination associated protein RdgC
MWFKNLRVYCFTQPFKPSAAQLQQQLLEQASRSCGKLERSTLGWASPLGEEYSGLVFANTQYWLIAARKEERILPTTVVRKQVKERIAVIEQEQQRKVGGRERRQITDEVTVALLPQAFIKESLTYAYIDNERQWLVINTASANKAEELLGLFKQCVGGVQLEPLTVDNSLSATFTDWIMNTQTPANFNVEENCELQDSRASKTLIKCINQDLAADEVRAHLDSGKQVVRLELTFQDRINFVLDSQLIVRRIRFLELVQDDRQAQEEESEVERGIADFTLCSGELSALLLNLLDVLRAETISTTEAGVLATA